MKRTLKQEVFSIIRRRGLAMSFVEILVVLETAFPDAKIPEVMAVTNDLVREKRLVCCGTKSFRVAPQVELNESEVQSFVSNAQVALAGANIREDRLNYLASYANSLEESLKKYSQLSEDELAFVLVSSAYNVKFPERS